MNGMKGWSSSSVWRSTRSWIARQFALRLRVLELRLRHLDVPVAEVVPEKSVERLGGRAELEFAEAAVDLARRRRAAARGWRGRRRRTSPGRAGRGWPRARSCRPWARSSGGSGRRSRACCRSSCRPRSAPPGSGCPGPGARSRRCRTGGRRRRTCRSGRAGRANCPSDFDILRPCGVADDAREIDVPERDPPLERLAGPDELEPGHDHAGDPEEDDVGRR